MTNYVASEVRSERVAWLRRQAVRPSVQEVAYKYGIARKTANELLTEADREHFGQYQKLWQMWPVRNV